MTSFLFIISFLLHIISITAIYALTKKLAITKSNDTSEIQRLMESYLEEIRLENQLLQKELSTSHPITKKEEEVSSIKEEGNATPQEIKEEEHSPFIGETVHDEITVSLQSRILMLYQDGVPTDEIARKLGCGKTEVELIIKFHEKSNIKT